MGMGIVVTFCDRQCRHFSIFYSRPNADDKGGKCLLQARGVSVVFWLKHRITKYTQSVQRMSVDATVMRAPP